jgi:hypothetical protein
VPYLDQIVIANSATLREGATWDLVGASWDIIEVPSVPVQAEFALLVSLLLSRDEALVEHELRMTLTAPDGSPQGQMMANVPASADEQLADLPPGGARAETVLVAKGVIFRQYGHHQLNLLWDGKPLREPMRLLVVEGNTAAEGS